MYKAYKNDVLFFQTDLPTQDTALTSATLNLQAGSAGSFTFTVSPENRIFSTLVHTEVTFSDGVAYYSGNTGALSDSISIYPDGMIYNGEDTTISDPFQTVISVTNGTATVDVTEGTTYTYNGTDRFLDLNLLTDYVTVYRDDDLIFSGRVYSVKKQFDTQLVVTCEGLLAVLNDSIFRPVTYSGTLHGLVTELLNSHNSQVGSDKQISVGNLTIDDSNIYRAYEVYQTTISRFQDLQNSFGGFINIRKESDGLYFDWTEYETGSSQRIDFKENLLDVNVTEDANDKITRLIPLGAVQTDGSKLTIKSVNNGLDYVEADFDKVAKYGIVTAVHEWEDVTEPANLLTKGTAYLNALLEDKVTIKVTAVDLADAGYSVDSFKVGNLLKVVSSAHEIDNWFSCTAQTLDLLHPANNRLTLGTAAIGYVQSQYRTQKQTVTNSALSTAVQSATALITGVKGGYIIMHDSDGDNYPDEILIMDTPDITTAVNVWRFNQNGWGHSSSGYNGTYTTAATLDGGFVADFISTGMLKGTTGNSYWDLDSGELYLEGSADITGGSVHISTDSAESDVILLNYESSSGQTFQYLICPSNMTLTRVYNSLTYKTKATPGEIDIDCDSHTARVAASSSTASFALIDANDYTRMQIQEGIGTFRTTSGGNAIIFQFVTHGLAYLYNSSGTATITLNGSSGAITCVSLSQTSDRNKKTDIEDLDTTTSESFIYGLKPSKFRYLDDETGTLHHGFIAQDVEEVAEGEWSVVSEDDNGIKALSYTEIIADLVATVQKQNERITELEKKLGE